MGVAVGPPKKNEGLEDLRRGLEDLRRGLEYLRRGLEDLRKGLEDLRGGLEDLRQDLEKTKKFGIKVLATERNGTLPNPPEWRRGGGEGRERGI